MEKHTFNVHELTCANCATKIENELKKQPNFLDVSLSFSQAKLKVVTKEETPKQVLLDQINEISGRLEKGVYVDEEEQTVFSIKKELTQLIATIATFILAYLLEGQSEWLSTILYGVSYLIVGYSVLLSSFQNIRKKEIFDENFLMSVATLAAIVLGQYQEAVAVMLFYFVGELFQSLAVRRSRKSITDLMDIKSDYANLLVDGMEHKVDPRELNVKDVVVVKNGEKIPVDGVVVKGSSSLDVSALNGEAGYKDVREHEKVLAGSLNMGALLEVQVEKIYEDSTVAKILDLVENAASKKAPIEDFITKFAKIYTPIVVILALLLTLIPPLFFGWNELPTWLYRGATFLVISCPCALVVSIPLGVFAGIGSSSRVGALIKGGNFLERLNDVNVLIFDKTGTISEGSFQVVEATGDNVLEYAAYGEYASNHPIALSIMESYGKNIEVARVNDYQERAGYGVEVLLDHKQLLVGNKRLMVQENIAFEEATALGSIVYVAYDHHYIGHIVVADKVKASSVEAIKRLKKTNIQQLVMLSGDKQNVAQAMANQVGIDQVYGELLPQDKVTILEDYIQKQGNVVAFVGDGINDAPSLIRADVGISMGAMGSDVAIEASDIVLMNDDLMVIPKVKGIAKKTKQVLTQNIVFALSIKLVVLFLTIFGLTNMWMGVFADVGVSILAILNSMRILRSYKHV